MLSRLDVRVLVEIGSDHTFDHLRLRTTWTQCAMKPWKASISDTKALKITRKCLFYKAFTVRELEAWSSNLHTSTKKEQTALVVVCSFFVGVFVQTSLCEAGWSIATRDIICSNYTYCTICKHLLLVRQDTAVAVCAYCTQMCRARS